MGNQYLSIDLPDRIWEVVVGSGMGIGCSGDVSDLALAIMAEISYALDPRVQAKYEIDLYVRFRDDIFIIIGGTPSLRRGLNSGGLRGSGWGTMSCWAT